MSSLACVLVVEDDENDAFFIQHAFKEAQLRNPIRTVKDGQEAIDYLSGVGAFGDRARNPRPCLVILDLKMPGKTGWDVLQWLRNQSDVPHLPVIVFSSSAQRDDIDRAYEMGANSFIVKPSGTQERTNLAKVIKTLWLEFNEPPSGCLNQ
jgi:CheY-like chemotaxis protein